MKKDAKKVSSFAAAYFPLSSGHSRIRADALFVPAAHDYSFVNGARKVNVCFAAAYFSCALVIS